MASMNNLTTDQKFQMGFSAEELAELKAARAMPITFDEECPETTPERAMKFRRVNPPRNSGTHA